VGFALPCCLELGKYGTETDHLSLADGESSSFDASSVRTLTGYVSFFQKTMYLNYITKILFFFFFICSWFRQLYGDTFLILQQKQTYKSVSSCE